MQSPAVQELGVRGKLHFIEALEAAGTFNKLPKEWQAVIRAGESQKSKRRRSAKRLMQNRNEM